MSVALTNELEKLKDLVSNMMTLVRKQTEQCREIFYEFDASKVDEIIAREKSVNNYDNKIDSKCEDILALYAPVAVDLRFVMSCLQINTYLERISDNSENIAKILKDIDGRIPAGIIVDLQSDKLFDNVDSMLDLAIESFEGESTKEAPSVFRLDAEIDGINENALVVIEERLKEEGAIVRDLLHLLIVIRKLERTGDLITNIAEENIFYVDAKVLKHKKKKKRKLMEKEDLKED